MFGNVVRDYMDMFRDKNAGRSHYTGCNRRKGPDFGRVFLMLKYTEENPKHLYPKLNGLGNKGQ